MGKPLLEMIKKEMESFSLPHGTGKILVGVSGGADSVCLLLALKELGYEVSAVHVEHGIRAGQSMEDCAFVRKLCLEYGIPLYISHVDVPACSARMGTGLEETARSERRRVFGEAAEVFGIHVLATAHHRMDQAETVLWNLIRGSSVAGLGGIRPAHREGSLLMIRPLLFCGKDQIEDWLTGRNITWRTDLTNYDVQITRNAIRLKIIPMLEELNAGAVMHIAQAASDLRQVEEWLQQEENELWERVVVEDGDGYRKDLKADRTQLSRIPDVLRGRILRRMIARCSGSLKDIARTHVRALDDLAAGRSSRRVNLPGGLVAFSEEGILRMAHQRKGLPEGGQVRGLEEAVFRIGEDGSGFFPASFLSGDQECRRDADWNGFPEGNDACPGKMIRADVHFLTWPGGMVPKKKYTKYLAYDTMTPCLVLRTRRPGDYLYVNASHGRKKLKDYLIDEKVPRAMRDSIPLIAQGSHVLWVIGMRISERAKVSTGASCARITVFLEEAL